MLIGPVLSLCHGMGLLDIAFVHQGFDVVPGCEIDPRMRAMYRQLVGGQPLFLTLEELAEAPLPFRPVGIIGGPPCQAHSKTKNLHKPKFPDLGPMVAKLVDRLRPDWYLFENVVRLPIPGAKFVRLDAMHFGRPHQSRPRWFTYSPSLTPPHSALQRGRRQPLRLPRCRRPNLRPEAWRCSPGIPSGSGPECVLR